MMIKIKKANSILLICIFFNYNNLFAANGGLEEISKGILGQIRCIETIDGRDIFYVGTESGLYETIDARNGWERVKLPEEISEVKRIAICNGSMFIAASGGIFVAKKNEPCKRILGNINIKGIAASLSLADYENVVAWSEKELFRVTKDRLEPLSMGAIVERIDDVICRNGTIYVASRGNIYYSYDSGKTWNKIFLLNTQDEIVEQNAESDMEEKNEEAEGLIIKNIDASGQGKLTIATNSDIFIIKEKDYSIERINTIGLPRRELSYAAYAGESLFAATDKRIFLYLDKDKCWETFSEINLPGNISFMKGQKDKNGKNWLWVGAGRYLYRQSLDFFSSVELNNVYVKNFPLVKENEVSIREVQRMAIEYAEVSPEKIKAWRNGAKWKAIMPQVSLGFSESTDDNMEIYTSSTTSYTVRGPRKKGNDWDIDFSWDLSDLIWNDAQTSIDVRSKLMVQLRDDILEEVTRLYFERKRLLMEIGRLEARGTENQDELLNKRLKIEELTAYIDAFTGGKFSESLRR